ncbi:MAG TPA: UTP--glucose-1-phosphate uridylyltransferase GalU [Terriglobia bacterium]
MTIRKAVLPVAGLGTRFLPATKAQPKEMLPIVDKPLVQYAVEEATRSGIKTIIFVIGAGKDSIKGHFERSDDLEQLLTEKGKQDLLPLVRFADKGSHREYVYQWNPRGLGDAILQARREVDDEPFAVLLPDDVIDSEVPCLKQMMEVYGQYKHSVVAIQEVERDAVSSYGIIKGHPVLEREWADRVYRVEDMVEKPKPVDAPSNLAIIGRYILTPALFSELVVTLPGAGGEVQLTDALRGLLKKEPIYGYIFEGRRYDAGDKLGFLEATVEMALKRSDLGKPFRKYLKTLKL